MRPLGGLRQVDALHRLRVHEEGVAAPLRASLKVVLADGQPIVREGLRTILTSQGMDVVAEVDQGADVLPAVRDLHPDILLLDIDFPDRDGLEVASEALSSQPSLKVVVFSAHQDVPTLRAAAEAGVAAYVLKTAPTLELVAMMRAVATDEARTSMATRGCWKGGPQTTTGLSARELQVLELAAEGASTSEIADSLFISIKTAKNHLASIYRKLGVRDRTEAVVCALKLGVIRLR